MLRQGDAQVFKKDSQMKIGDEARSSGKAQLPTSEMLPASSQSIGTVTVQWADLARSRPEIMIRSGHQAGKCFRINSANDVGA
jgi:hypothetical protein